MIIKNNSLEVFRTCNYIKNEKLNAFVSDNLYLSIVVTNACQCDCPYCINSMTDKSLHLPLEKAKENIRKAIKELGIKEAVILGGEPTLYPHLFELIDFLKELGLRKFGLTTNGIMLTDYIFLRSLILTGIDFINISFHNEDFISLKQLKQIRKIFLAYRKQNQKMRINTNVWKGNHDTVNNLYLFTSILWDYCDEIRVSNIIYKDDFSVNPLNKKEAEQIHIDDKEYEKLFSGFVKRSEERYTIIHNPAALGFVNYFLIPSPTPVIINWNIDSKVSEQICENNLENNKIHTIKCLVTGDLSLSWNLNNKIVL